MTRKLTDKEITKIANDLVAGAVEQDKQIAKDLGVPAHSEQEVKKGIKKMFSQTKRG